ncbi:MAG: 4-hydroxy-3-methylbut-2-enyl diphosphate reductase [Erysipelotrichaceae bacterium]|nr:4-hydroxy-3-methylbut-2-enyl diphosphate reductase [Erysipelotrichaceae bacterium]
MNVIPIVPRGFCKGVIRAIKTAKTTRTQYPDKNITVLGMIVHNRYIVEALEQLNIRTLDDSRTSRFDLVDRIEDGVVILTAHGTDDATREKAIRKGLIVVDAVCDDVMNTKIIIQKALSEHKEVLYIGKKNHPEAQAMCSIDPKHIHLITSVKDARECTIEKKAYLLTNQTTMSLLEIRDIIEELSSRIEGLEIQPELCSATRLRQQAILKQEADGYIVVGDPRSNNSRKLADLAATHNKPVWMIESVDDLKDITFDETMTIAVTSGASTPTILTNQVIAYLQQYPCECPDTVKEGLLG